MSITIEKLKDLSTTYLYFIIFGTALFTILLDCKSLNKKKLKREEKIARFIGYGYIVIGVGFFILTKFVF